MTVFNFLKYLGMAQRGDYSRGQRGPGFPVNQLRTALLDQTKSEKKKKKKSLHG